MTEQYHHVDDNDIYTHSTPIRLDPREQKPVPIPRASFRPLPDLNEYETVKLVNDDWVVISDYRGYLYWTPETGLIEITEVEVSPPDNAQVLAEDQALIKDGVWRLKTYDDELNEEKENAKIRIASYATDQRSEATKYADQYKVAGWTRKAERAARYIKNEATTEDIEHIQTECDKRGKGETVEQLVQKHIDKSYALDNATSVIDAMEESAFDAVDEVTSTMEIEALLDNLKQEAIPEEQKIKESIELLTE